MHQIEWVVDEMIIDESDPIHRLEWAKIWVRCFDCIVVAVPFLWRLILLWHDCRLVILVPLLRKLGP